MNQLPVGSSDGTPLVAGGGPPLPLARGASASTAVPMPCSHADERAREPSIDDAAQMDASSSAPVSPTSNHGPAGGKSRRAAPPASTSAARWCTNSLGVAAGGWQSATGGWPADVVADFAAGFAADDGAGGDGMVLMARLQQTEGKNTRT